jgi:hypothetical protein
MYSVRDTLAGGFPHSEISGSKLTCQLPEAYRRLSRPSSPVIAKASTTCTSSLDPITLTSTAVHAVKDASILPIDVMSMSRCAVLQALNRFKLKSGDAIKCCCWHGCAPSNSRSAPPATTLIRLYELLKNNSRSLRIAHANAPKDARMNARHSLVWMGWWRMTGSNRRPPACKAGALPAELIPRRTRGGGSGWIRTNDPRLIKTVL